jgi:hypothetical protein
MKAAKVLFQRMSSLITRAVKAGMKSCLRVIEDMAKQGEEFATVFDLDETDEMERGDLCSCLAALAVYMVSVSFVVVQRRVVADCVIVGSIPYWSGYSRLFVGFDALNDSFSKLFG